MCTGAFVNTLFCIFGWKNSWRASVKYVKYVTRRHQVSPLAFSQASACAYLRGSILPHCSKAVNTFAAACQATVKYCLCSLGPISRQLKAAMKTELLPDLQYVEYIYINTEKQIRSVSIIVQQFIKWTACENTVSSSDRGTFCKTMQAGVPCSTGWDEICEKCLSIQKASSERKRN